MSEWSMHKIGTKLRDLPLLQGAIPQYQASEVGMGTKEFPTGRLLALDSDGKYLLGCHGPGAEIYKVSLIENLHKYSQRS